MWPGNLGNHGSSRKDLRLGVRRPHSVCDFTNGRWSSLHGYSHAAASGRGCRVQSRSRVSLRRRGALPGVARRCEHGVPGWSEAREVRPVFSVRRSVWGGWPAALEAGNGARGSQDSAPVSTRGRTAGTHCQLCDRCPRLPNASMHGPETPFTYQGRCAICIHVPSTRPRLTVTHRQAQQLTLTPGPPPPLPLPVTFISIGSSEHRIS